MRGRHPCLCTRDNRVQAFIPVARITDMLDYPGRSFNYNGRSHVYPRIELIYWAGGNPFHHHQDLARLGARAAVVAAAAARRRFGDAPRSDAEISHVKRSHEGEVHWTSRPINLNERPALASLHAMVPSTKPAEEIP